jgi:hypothetical protein
VSRDWFVKPDEIDHLDLGDGEWIKIKKELNYGEYRQFKKNAGVSLTDINLTLDNLVDFVHPVILAFVVDWSVRNGKGETAEISEQVINSMHTDQVFAMGLKIVTHVGALAQEKKATKKAATEKASKKRKPKPSETSSS